MEDLWPTGWNKNVKNFQHFLIEDIREVNTFNKNVLEQKRNTLVAAEAATGVEVLFVGLTLLYLVRDKLVRWVWRLGRRCRLGRSSWSAGTATGTTRAFISSESHSVHPPFIGQIS